MSDGTKDASLKGPADPTRIDIYSASELRHWIREIGRPAGQIKYAVGIVGPLVVDVRNFLRHRSLYEVSR